ncbi:hypothetical protein L873DRAFT_1820033 [Choiromyces venosus 120613-1]|uniref:Uncharacterized protein n=1 Tax=Choiromyces venosus 120613-1 TaxID=1336337 RepID=A0A3N4J1Z1_9PEZI|nr:hypothetical protein L873DRAFT_1820033 [Choiromyces venosus 120613-1]
MVLSLSNSPHRPLKVSQKSVMEPESLAVFPTVPSVPGRVDKDGRARRPSFIKTAVLGVDARALQSSDMIEQMAYSGRQLQSPAFNCRARPSTVGPRSHLQSLVGTRHIPYLETLAGPARPSHVLVWTDAKIPVRPGHPPCTTVRPVRARRRTDWTLGFIGTIMFACRVRYRFCDLPWDWR